MKRPNASADGMRDRFLPVRHSCGINAALRLDRERGIYAAAKNILVRAGVESRDFLICGTE
jgi:hypothetical protein